MQKPSGLARSLTAWVGLILSMMVSASLFGTVALMATERSCLLSLECWRGSPPLALFAAGVTGSVTAVVGPLFLAFLPSVLQPRFPFFRRGFWIFAIAPNSPFFAFYLFETMVDLRGGGIDPGLLGIHTIIVIPGALIFIAAGRPLGLFDDWPPSKHTKPTGVAA